MAIISEARQREAQARLQARTAETEVRKYLPRQMAFWSDDRRAIANELARSALFGCGDGRKPREFFDNAPLFVLGEGALTYTGEELREHDEDLFIALAHCARERPSGELVVKVTSSDICKMNKWRQGQRYYDDIYRSIQRMKGGVITVFSRRLTKALKCQRALENGASDEEMQRLYDELAAFEKSVAADLPLDKAGEEISGMMLTLISGNPTFSNAKSVKDNIPQGNLTWEIPLDKNFVALFAKPYLTLVDFNARQGLTATGKRLQSYFTSHKQPYPVLLRSLEKMLRLNYKEIKTLKYNLNIEFEALKAAGIIKDFSYEKSADGTDWKVTVIRATTHND